jgi:aminocarboxymuconate-semialdehyde decarboxylase
MMGAPVRINVHSHVMPLGSDNSAGDAGPTFTTDGNGLNIRFANFDRIGLKSVDMLAQAETIGMESAARNWLESLRIPELRLGDMDRKGIDILGVTMSPIMYGYFLDAQIGKAHAHQQNISLAKYCDANRDRLFFMATLPMQDVKAAAAEVDFAVGELGAKGINIAGSLLGGHELDSPELDTIWERVQHNDVPIFIHPSLHTSSGDTASEKWSPILGYPFQETLAFATILVGGVLDRFPGLKFYITHGGGFAPYQFGRIERMAPAYGFNRSARPLREYLPNFFFDLLIHDPLARRFLVEWASPAQCIIGDNYDGVDSADGFAFLDELKLPDRDAEAISGENAAALFHLSLASEDHREVGVV